MQLYDSKQTNESLQQKNKPSYISDSTHGGADMMEGHGRERERERQVNMEKEREREREAF